MKENHKTFRGLHTERVAHYFLPRLFLPLREEDTRQIHLDLIDKPSSCTHLRLDVRMNQGLVLFLE